MFAAAPGAPASQIQSSAPASSQPPAPASSLGFGQAAASSGQPATTAKPLQQEAKVSGDDADKKWVENFGKNTLEIISKRWEDQLVRNKVEFEKGASEL